MQAGLAARHPEVQALKAMLRERAARAEAGMCVIEGPRALEGALHVLHQALRQPRRVEERESHPIVRALVVEEGEQRLADAGRARPEEEGGQLLLVHPGTHTDNVAVEGLRQRCLDRSVRSLLLVDYPYSLSLSLCVSAFGN